MKYLLKIGMTSIAIHSRRNINIRLTPKIMFNSIYLKTIYLIKENARERMEHIENERMKKAFAV